MQSISMVEHPFGTMKRAMNAGYTLLKGKNKVKGEFGIIALTYNIKRVISDSKLSLATMEVVGIIIGLRLCEN